MANERHPRTTVVVTLGSEGCAVAKGGSVSRIAGVEGSSLGAEVRNTTGCGDAFLGVFAGNLMLGRSALEAANWANLAGAMKATRIETRGSPLRRDLEETMKRLAAQRGRVFGA